MLFLKSLVLVFIDLGTNRNIRGPSIGLLPLVVLSEDPHPSGACQEHILAAKILDFRQVGSMVQSTMCSIFLHVSLRPPAKADANGGPNQSGRKPRQRHPLSCHFPKIQTTLGDRICMTEYISNLPPAASAWRLLGWVEWGQYSATSFDDSSNDSEQIATSYRIRVSETITRSR